MNNTHSHTQCVCMHSYDLADIYIWAAEKRQPRDQVCLRWIQSNISHDCDRLKFRRFAGTSARPIKSFRLKRVDLLCCFATIAAENVSHFREKITKQNSSKSKTSLFQDISITVKCCCCYFRFSFLLFKWCPWNTPLVPKIPQLPCTWHCEQLLSYIMAFHTDDTSNLFTSVRS